MLILEILFLVFIVCLLFRSKILLLTWKTVHTSAIATAIYNLLQWRSCMGYNAVSAIAQCENLHWIVCNLSVAMKNRSDNRKEWTVLNNWFVIRLLMIAGNIFLYQTQFCGKCIIPIDSRKSYHRTVFFFLPFHAIEHFQRLTDLGALCFRNAGLEWRYLELPEGARNIINR